MTIREVTRYQTKDGKIHETLDKAKNHVVDNVAEVFDRKLRPLLKEVNEFWKVRELIKLVVALTGNYEDVEKLIKELNNAFEMVDISEDEDCITKWW